MVNVNYSLVGSNGDTIAFDYSNYVLNPDFTGFGIPPAQVRIEPSAGDGGVFRHSKKSVRDVDLPITILGIDRADVQAKLRRLSRLVQDTAGPTRIVANYSNGDVLFLEGHYVGGAESQWGSSAGMIWNRWALSFQCPKPFWQSGTEETFTIDTSSTGRGLLPELTKLKLRSATTFGVINVDNQGDVPAFPIWEITGPLEDVVISDGTNSFAFEDNIADGEIITINTETGSVTDGTGANRYAMLASAPKLFRVPPGETTITVSAVAGSLDAEVTFTYSPRFEVVH